MAHASMLDGDAGGEGTGTTVNNTLVRMQGSERDVPLVFLFNSGTQPNQTFITKMVNNIIDIKVSYSISAATAVTFQVLDPGFEFTTQNYFQPGQTFIYRSHNSEVLSTAQRTFLGSEEYIGYFMEIADVSISQSQGSSPIIRVSGYTKAIQQMKRDRKPGVIKGANQNFVVNAATKYGLGAVVQKTSKDKDITSADGEKMADSLWDVLLRLASESKDENKNPYTLFEMDGTLYFGTQQWLMYKRGVDSYKYFRFNTKTKKTVEEAGFVTYLHYPPRVVDGVKDNRFILMELPNMHKAENDPLEGDGSCVVDRLNGVRLRPGMTVNVGDIPWHTGDFLITTVDFDEMVSDPVAVTFATPPIQEKQVKQIEIGTIYPGSVDWATVIGLSINRPTPRYQSSGGEQEVS